MKFITTLIASLFAVTVFAADAPAKKEEKAAAPAAKVAVKAEKDAKKDDTKSAAPVAKKDEAAKK
jgi:hypothetical protein